MPTHRADEPIRQTVTVPPVPAEAAFAAFADLARWWPPEYTWAAGTLETIGIEPRQGGHCFERGPHGFTLHWGRVLAWEPPATAKPAESTARPWPPPGWPLLLHRYAASLAL